MNWRLLATVLAVLGGTRWADGQAVRPLPYSSQLKTDPSVGNIQGIQRYGRSLKTDPQEGEGYSYHVYPTTSSGTVVIGADTSGRVAGQSQTEGMRSKTVADLGTIHADLKSALERMRRTDPNSQDLAGIQGQIADVEAKIRSAERQFESQAVYAKAAIPQVAVIDPSLGSASPYPPPFDATAGLRNYELPPASPPPTFLAPPGIVAESKVYVPALPGEGKAPDLAEVHHQPLIQVKLRVVEVVRGDQLQVGSVLDYVSRDFNGPTLINGNNVNGNRQNLSGGSRFRQESLVGLGPATVVDGKSNLTNLSGTGMLVNLTSKHINYIAELLATELNGDVVTAPEVVTLNGQNVEFVAGDKVPFALGQNVIVGESNNIQQFFYKNVGTYVSVTPKIVNWGFHGEGDGKAPIASSEIRDWYHLLQWVSQQPPMAAALSSQNLASFSDPRLLIPFDVKSAVLKELSKYPRESVISQVQQFYAKASPSVVVFAEDCEPNPCRWKPEDCTIDLAVVVRLSELGSQAKTVNFDPGADTAINTEANVRAIANVIQVKSGNGVVMAGLIGENEFEQVAKVPVLGDVPFLGFLFRSKATRRDKTEVLIFLEARVLDPQPEVARAQSHDDFLLGHDYVRAGLLDNPLEYGMYRAGFGSYLPPNSCQERIFWERTGRSVRKIVTHVDDAVQ